MNDVPAIQFEVCTTDKLCHHFYERFDSVAEAVDYFREQIEFYKVEGTAVSIEIIIEIGGEEGEDYVIESYEFNNVHQDT